MKTKIKRHGRSVISVILAISMLVSCMMVGLIATDAAKVTDESVGDNACELRYDVASGHSGWYNLNNTLTLTSYSGDFYTGTLSLAASTEYYMFIKVDDTYYKNGTTINSEQELTMNDVGSNNYGNQSSLTSFTSSTAGDYTIVWDNSAKTLRVIPPSETCVLTWVDTNGTNTYDRYYDLPNKSTMSGSDNIYTVTLNDYTTTKHYMFVKSGDYYFRAANTLTTDGNVSLINKGNNNYGGTADKTNHTASISGNYKFTWNNITKVLSVTSATTTLLTPTISFANGGAVNSGDGAVLTVTNHSDIVDQGDTSMSYALFKNNTLMTSGSGYSYNNNGVFTITDYANGDRFKVQAVTGNTNSFVSSEVSSEATLTVYEPKFALLGNVGSADIYDIVNATEIHASTATRGWPSTTVDDATYFTGNSSVVVSQATSTPGIYKIVFTTVSNKDSIDISLYEKGVGQTSFNIDGFQPTVGNDYYVPSAGKSGIGILSNPDAVGSMKFKPGITYTITVNQINNTMDITSDAADITAIARVKTFDPTTGALNTSVSNATAAVGTASASPSAGKTPFTSTLTATVADSTKYEFAGWYTDAACSASYNNNATTTANVTTDVTYYALFTQKTPDTVELTVETTGTGSVTATSGTHSGSGSSYTIYPGATVVFTATPGTDYELSSATSTSGTVTKSGNTVTVSNITEAATVSFTFTEVQTYDVTLQADSSTYGSLTATYVNKSGSSVTTSAITDSTTITVKQGEVVSLTATAKTNGNFNGWTLTSGAYQRSASTPLSAKIINIKPTANMSATANFSQIVTTTTAFYTDIWTGNTSVSNEAMKQYTGSSYDGKTDLLKATVPLTAGTTYNIQFKYNNSTVLCTNQSATSWNWYQSWNNQYTTFTPSTTGTYTILAKLDVTRTDQIQAILLEGDVDISSSGGDDTPDVDDYTKLYVLDGIRGDGNSNGTNLFGDTTIISANSGLATYNYYDVTGSDLLLSSDAGHSEGGLLYYYNPGVDLDFRVQTTIKSNHQAIGVRAFVMNGMTYPAKKDKNGNYYADITLESDSNQGVLEVIPVYYNTLIPDSDYIKFYVDANTIGDNFGKTIGYSLWYTNTALHGMEGAYPGQPLMSDGTLLYGYFPKYYVDVNASTLPAASSRTYFSGVLLTNLAEHNETHKDVLTAWGASTINYQTFDYEDPYVISQIPDIDTIEFVAKYQETDSTDPIHRDGTHWYNSSYNKKTDLNGKSYSYLSGGSIPSSKSDLGDYELLRDIDGNPVDVYGNKITENFSNAVFAVSVGNQKVGSNLWDTVWEIYDKNKSYITSGNPASFINVDESNQSTSLKNKTVYINYEKFLDGAENPNNSGNSGDRIDGRWLYSRSSDDTTLRLRVATEENGTLTFMEDGISWAEINDGTNNGPLETADTTNLTKILELDNRTTEVTAKINPVGYTVEGMYMLGASYSGSDNNGYSTDLDDYDDMNVTGTATSFVNAKDNRMVIVVKKILETDLVITHQMYGGPGAHKIKGFYYFKAELLNSSGTTVKTYNNGDFTNKPLTLSGFTNDAPKNGKYQLKVTIRTVMSGSASFNQWYENDHNNGYDEIDSTDAHGSTNPVEKEIIVDVDSLYGESSLNIKNLDYYSDLQAAGSVNINHLLTPATTAAGMNGTTYTQVTVINSSGNPISGGSYSAKARTTEVGSDFITTDYAEDGYQLKVEIWTIPTAPAEFDAFYKNTTTEMTTEVDGGIVYTIGQTKTFNGSSYSSATVIVPISYFFKEVYDEEESNVLQFDSTKQNFYLYSALKVGYKYSLHFDFQGYRNLYGNLGYDYSAQEFTVDELNNYFELSDSVTDTNGDTVTAYTFKDDDAREAFINLKAPYENTFMETVKWQTDMYEAGVHDEGMTANYNSTTRTWSYVVKLKKTDNRYAFATFRFPYQVQQYTDKHAAQTSTVTIDGESVDAVVKLTNNEYVEKGGRSNTTTNYRTGYGNNYTISGNYVTAPQKIWNSTDSCWEYFDYWKVENVGDDKTGSAEYTRCYYPEFNLSLYQDSIITPVYSTAAQGTSPSQRAARDDTARTDTYSTNGRATITLMENSRMQWTAGRNGNTLSGNYVNGGDRIYTDFLVSYTYQDLQLNTDTTGMNAGVVIETVRDLDTENDEFVTKTQAEYKTSDDDSIDKSAVEAYIENGTGSSFLKTEFSVTTLDNKNRKNQYYSLPNISQTTHDETTRKNKLYRAYSYLKDSSGNVILISDPIYFTIYDIASIENMAAGASYGGVS